MRNADRKNSQTRDRTPTYNVASAVQKHNGFDADKHGWWRPKMPMRYGFIAWIRGGGGRE